MGTDTSRITIRVPERDLTIIDALVETGEFTNRTAVIRRAIRDFLEAQGPKMAESAKSNQALTAALLQMQEMQQQMEEQRKLLEQLMRK